MTKPTFTVDCRETNELFQDIIKNAGGRERMAYNGPANVFGPLLSKNTGNNKPLHPFDLPLFLYLHGSLENDLCYDLPVFLHGTIDYKSIQEADVINPFTMEVHNCKIILFHRKDMGFHGAIYGLIGYADESDELYSAYLTGDWEALQEI